jgi:hypothetical protein
MQRMQAVVMDDAELIANARLRTRMKDAVMRSGVRLWRRFILRGKNTKRRGVFGLPAPLQNERKEKVKVNQQNDHLPI